MKLLIIPAAVPSPLEGERVRVRVRGKAANNFQAGQLLNGSRSPSPRPSPPGRGRIVSRVLANPRLPSARWLSNFSGASNGCSLSQRERVRVRENISQNRNHKIFTR
jgi:hypothetical protein